MLQVDPVLMEFGAFVLTSPDGSHRIPPDLWPDVALTIVAAPARDVRARWVVGIDEALASRAEAAREAAGRRRSRRAEEEAHVASLAGRLRDPRIAAKIDEKAALAARHVARAKALREENPKKNRQAAKALEAMARKLGEEIAKLIEEEQAQELWGDARGPILAAAARGEEVEVEIRETAAIALNEYGGRIIEQSGPRRGLPALVYSTGARAKLFQGIDHALAAGDLSGHVGCPAAETLHRIGCEYREAYVIVEGQTTNAGSEGGGGGFGPKSPQPRVVEAGEALAVMRRALSPPQRGVLDEVCGKDARVREYADAIGSSSAVVARLLATGLRQARDAIKVAREEGRIGGAGARVAAVSAVLRRVRA